jgi:CRP-like cAMP-binding protein
MNPQLPEALQRRVDSFVSDSGLPREIVDELISHHTIVTYPKGSALFLQGSPADMFFWVFSGTVEVFCPQSDGERVLMRLCGPGEILGHVDFIDHKQRRAQMFEAHARTKCEVALLTREHISRLLQTLEPTQLIRLLEYVNTLWSAAANSWATFISLDYRERLELVLKDLASRFGVEDSRGILLITDLLHAKLAEMIGSSRPMITRLINEMVDQGVLARRGKQYVLLNRPERPAHAALNHYDGAPRTAQPVFTPRVAIAKAPLQPRNGNGGLHSALNGRTPDRGLLSATAGGVTRNSALKS